MAHAQTSAKGGLKRKLAIIGVAVLGSGVILHFALPWFDFLQLLGWVVGIAVEYPEAIAIPIAFIALVFIMAAVDDRFQA